MKKSFPIALATIVLYALYAVLQSIIPSPKTTAETIEVTYRMSFKRLSGELEDKGIIRDKYLFRVMGFLTGVDRSLKPGKYKLGSSSTPWTAFKTIYKSMPEPWTVIVREGDSLDDIKTALMNEGLARAEDFDRLRNDSAFLSRYLINAPSIEGYLYPDTYFFVKGAPIENMLNQMIKRLRVKFGPELMSRAGELGLSENEVLTLASIIEKETADDGERAVVSAVYHNRLRMGMRLQADPTSIYGFKPMREGISVMDIKRQSPYNTYIIYGLPPGPIASPGIKSIHAALYPADVPYLYFVYKNNGSHEFSVNLKEHQKAVERLKKLKSRTAKKINRK